MADPAMAASFTAEELNAIVEQRVREALETAAGAVDTPVEKPPEPAFDAASIKRLVTIVGALAAAGPALVGAILWFLAVGGDWRERELEKTAQDAVIQETAERLDAHIETATSTWDEIKTATIENQVLIVDSVDHISKKLDALGPGAKREVEPRSLENAREVTNRAKAEQALFGKPPVTHTPNRE